MLQCMRAVQKSLMENRNRNLTQLVHILSVHAWAAHAFGVSAKLLHSQHRGVGRSPEVVRQMRESHIYRASEGVAAHQPACALVWFSDLYPWPSRRIL